MTGRRLLGALATAGVSAFLLAVPAVAAPSGGITSPDPGAELTARDQVAIHVNFTSRDDLQEVVLSVESVRGERRDEKRFDMDQSSFSYTWSEFEPGTTDYNGEYRTTAVATDNALFGERTTESARTFRLAIPPVAPESVGATFDDDARIVTVTWQGNTEPDLIGYLVQRSSGGDGPFEHAGEVPAGVTTFTDETEELEPGRYSYRVVALRQGAYTSEEKPDEPYIALNSDPSRTATATVSPRPQPTTTAAPASPGSPTTQAPAVASAGKVDLTGFASLLNQSRRPAPAPRPTEPDTGFSGLLPYGPAEVTTPPETTVPPEADVVLAQEDGDDDTDEGERLRSMAFLAGGFLAFVVAMHGWWLKGEAERMPLEATDVIDDGDENESPAADTEASPVEAPPDENTSPLDVAPPDQPPPPGRRTARSDRGASPRLPSRAPSDRRRSRHAVRASR